jgi:hypothetical protein
MPDERLPVLTSTDQRQSTVIVLAADFCPPARLPDSRERVGYFQTKPTSTQPEQIHANCAGWNEDHSPHAQHGTMVAAQYSPQAAQLPSSPRPPSTLTQTAACGIHATSVRSRHRLSAL